VGANLAGANLLAADLHRTNISFATLREAELASANLAGTELYDTDLTGANLSGANLAGAVVASATFGQLRSQHCGRLEAILHAGPSTVGVDTMHRSKGKIPESFLRGCGVPEDFITYAKSLATNPIEFYSCFISYSTKDQDFADRLYADLQNKGVRCWFAPHDVQGGRKLHEQIDEAIRLHDKLLLILSPYSMESEWVKTEIAKARKREVRDERRVLFPIRLAPFETLRDWECFDADTGKDSPARFASISSRLQQLKNHDPIRKPFSA